MLEILELRRENSKTYDLGGNKRQLVASIGAIHYKDNYADPNEAWKDIDLTWEGNRITKAPYILGVKGSTITFTSKRTGTVQTLALNKVGTTEVGMLTFVFSGKSATCQNVVLDTDIVIEAWARGVKFKRILKSKNAPLQAEFIQSKVVGRYDDILMPTLAKDADDNPLAVTKTDALGKLTETLDSKIDLSKVKFPIEIDPSPLIVQPAGKDNYGNEYSTVINTNYGSSTLLIVDNDTFDPGRCRPFLEFSLAGLPAGVTITAATLGLYYYQYYSTNDPVGRTYWAYRLTRTDWSETQSTWNIYKTGSNWTAAGGDYTTTNGASVVVPAEFGWMSWNVLAQAQYAQTNTIATEFLIRDGAESGATEIQGRFYSNNYTTDTSRCPKLVIDYTVAGGLSIPVAIHHYKLMRS